MAMEVSSRMDRDTSESLVTRDLLWEFSKPRKNEEDEQSGILETQTSQKCYSPDSPLSSSSSIGSYPTINLNRHRPSNLGVKNTLLMEEDCSLELKLSPSWVQSNRHQFQSVCTLDKVRTALKRAEKQEISKKRKCSQQSNSPSSSSSSSFKEKEESGEKRETKRMRSTGLMFAAGCPGCFLYVITSRANPKCPRCSYMISPESTAIKGPNASFCS